MADRYTYIPLISEFNMLVWGMGDFEERLRKRVTILLVASATICLLVTAARQQTKYQRDRLSFLEHAPQVTKRNQKAHDNLASFSGSSENSRKR